MKNTLRILFFIFLLLSGRSILFASVNNDMKLGLDFSESGVYQEPSDTPFYLYVNEGVLYVKYIHPGDLNGCEISIFNILGQEILHKKLDTSVNNQITLPLKNTCYIVRITLAGNIYTKKIIVTE